MNKQITLSMINDELTNAKTSKKEFLDKMEQLIPWSEFIGIIKPIYYKGEIGNKPYDLELMLRIFILQNLYDLADMKAMNEVIDSRAFSEFCGVDSPDQVPDGDTIGRFRNLLEKHDVQEKIFAKVVEILTKKGLILKRGTIVDSTLIAAPASTKNKEKKRDPEAHSTKKGNQYYLGFKAHIGVDKDTGIAHTVKATAANVHDVTMTSQLMHGEEEGLAAVAELGWLKQPKRRDEMIAFAAEKGKTECTAWFLDFKNRTAELERAEKKQERGLNAAPDPAIMLKQFWSFKKKEDGTIIITGYKEDKTEITVPERIGKSIVTEIGERAFSPNALRITEEQAIVRCRITKITVPPSVKVIGAEAFGGSGACKGNFNAFSLLEEVILPENLEFFANKKAAENAPIIFRNCPRLTVKIPHSPYAEIFCRKNKVNYSFTEGSNGSC